MENFFKKIERNNNESAKGESEESNEKKIIELDTKIEDIYKFMIKYPNCDQDKEAKKIKDLESQIETLKLNRKPGSGESLKLETNRSLEDLTPGELETMLAKLRTKQMDFDSDFDSQDKEKIEEIEEILSREKVA